ncbi:hypothetical protein KSP40_PGU001041 [Platanthera guangdongensis]|uniref:Uncharacterized protein n=1 Tax=Platanthera guangdongensis TaxID=2320717 RepID=A0ABR2M4C6_9ASPA
MSCNNPVKSSYGQRCDVLISPFRTAPLFRQPSLARSMSLFLLFARHRRSVTSSLDCHPQDPVLCAPSSQRNNPTSSPTSPQRFFLLLHDAPPSTTVFLLLNSLNRAPPPKLACFSSSTPSTDLLHPNSRSPWRWSTSTSRRQDMRSRYRFSRLLPLLCVLRWDEI